MITRSSTSVPLHVEHLDWLDGGTYSSLEGRGGGGRLVLAADCVYDRGAVAGLVLALRHALQHGRGGDQAPIHADDCVVLVASTMRNEATFAYFLSELERVGLQHEDVTGVYVAKVEATGLASPFVYENREAVRLTRVLDPNRAR